VPAFLRRRGALRPSRAHTLEKGFPGIPAPYRMTPGTQFMDLGSSDY
jgi:hypothetical protein